MGRKKLFEMCIDKIYNIKEKKLDKTEKNAISVAREILEALEIKKVPVDISEILTGLGFKIYALNSLKNNISGIIFISHDLMDKFGTDKIIIVNSEDTFGRQRFTLAHEFSHFIFDFDLSSNAEFIDLYDIENSDNGSEKVSSRFAAELLMPADIFLNEISKISNEKVNYYDKISKISDIFGVSTKSVERRFVELKDEISRKDSNLLDIYNIS